MNKRFRKLILPVSILATSQAYALGLGNLQVSSALDETLSGEIPLIIDSSEDIEKIVVSLASDSDYKRVGLDKSYVPTNIVVNIVEKNEVKYIEISSNGPVSEPIVSLLISVDWSNGHLLREYTILLDPPLFNTSQTQQNYSEPVQTQTYEVPTQIEPKAQTIPDVEPVASSSPTPSYTRNSQVVVEAGDTLWKIAGTISDGYGSRQQSMVAIFNKNPSAFQNNDMNMLRKGAVLEMPDANDVSMISSGDAIAEVKSHIQNWSSLQTKDDGSDIYDSGSSVDYGIELVPPSDSDSSNSNNTSGTSNSADNSRLRSELNLTKEQLVSTKLENEELSSRVGDLEEIVQDQESAISLKDTNLAQLQDQLANVKEDDVQESTSDDVWDDSIQNDSTNDLVQNEPDADDLDTQTNTGVETTDDDSLVLTDENTDDETTGSDNLSLTDLDSDQNEVKQEPVAQPVQAPQKARSMMDKILDYKFEGLIALGVLLLSGLAFMFFKRRSEESEDSEVGGFLDSISSKDDSLDESNMDSGSELDMELDSDSDDDSNVITEVNLSNLDVEDALDGDDAEPEVVVMDDQSDDELEQSLDLDIDESELNDTDVDSELEELDFSELDEENDDSDALEVEDLSLDFDLDDLELDTSEEIDDSEEAEESDEEESEEEDLSLDFDMTEEDLDLDSDVEDPVTVDIESDEESEKSNNTDDDSAEEEMEDLEFDLSDLYDADDVNLDADDEDTSSEQETTEQEESEDEDNLDLDFEAVSLDLDESEETDGEDLASADEGDDTMEIDFDDSEEVDIGLDFDDLTDDDAIDTKLDLAKAYFEMGDIDGAKQMVEEIIEEGTDEQKSKAQELKSDIEKS